MKVRDLIKDTIWNPGADYGRTPQVSVLLPTFRRGADGLFMKAAKSVLNQTLRDIELIIIDDASTDGTADQIRELMRRDPRVSCLTHPKNIGLPAISEYEAFIRSKGEYLAFAFDDFVFASDALQGLLAQAERSRETIVHGYIEWFDSLGDVNTLGKDPEPHEMLTFMNFLCNSSFLVRRQILETVGLYDPHIAAARLCDWDLWRRIMAECPLQRVDVFCGREHGPSRPDSLGNSYPLRLEATLEYFALPRNASLKASAFEDFDVWQLPDTCSASLAAHILEMRRFFAAKDWAQNAPFFGEYEKSVAFRPQHKVLGIVTHLEASSSIFFDGLRKYFPGNLILINPKTDRFYLQMALSRCDAVIVVRHLFDQHSQFVIERCHLARIPLYYFIDDNFIVLAHDHPEYSAYTLRNLSSVLKKFEEVFCGSSLLAEYFDIFKIHPRVSTLQLCHDDFKLQKLNRLAPKRPSKRLKVGFIGGAFRETMLAKSVIPALSEIHAERRLILYSRSKARMKGASFAVQHVDFSASFDEFLNTWQPLGLDILVHPEGFSKNISFKNANVMLIAHYLRAVPVVGNEEAFREFGEEQGVVKVFGQGPASWKSAILKVIDPDFRAEMLKRLDACCTHTFSPTHNVAVIRRILENATAADLLTLDDRVRQYLKADVAHSGFSVPAQASSVEELDGLKAKLDRTRDEAWHHQVRSRALEAYVRDLLTKEPDKERPAGLNPEEDRQFSLRLIEASGLFDPEFYAAENPDVIQSGYKPIEHYLDYGGAEGRAASPEFDSRLYLKANPDVASSGMNPLVHFLCHGVLEQREFRPVDRLPIPRSVEPEAQS